MTTVAELVDTFLTDERTVVMLDSSTVLALAVAAVAFYAGYADLEENEGIDPPFPDITEETDLSMSEMTLIKPLFLLYLERETALPLEATRGLGVDVFGRSSSEVQQDITQAHEMLPHKAAFQPVITV